MDTLTETVAQDELIPESDGSYDFDVTAGFVSGAAYDSIAEEAPVVEAEVPATEVPTTEPEDRDINFTAKIDHNETNVSIKESEVATYYQKAQNMDRAVQRANEAQEKLDAMTARMNRLAAVGKATLGLEGDDPDTILANMENGMTDTAIKSRARTYKNTDAEIAEAHVRSTLKDTIDESVKQFGVSKPAETTADASAEESNGVRPFEEFSKDLEHLIQVRPELKDSAEQFPREVIQYYQQGMDIVSAYSKYEADKIAAENAELKKQNAILAQNSASAKKAPLRSGVSNTGAAMTADDPMTQGFERRRRY